MTDAEKLTDLYTDLYDKAARDQAELRLARHRIAELEEALKAIQKAAIGKSHAFPTDALDYIRRLSEQALEP